jgi:hypothetical protein
MFDDARSDILTYVNVIWIEGQEYLLASCIQEFENKSMVGFKSKSLLRVQYSPHCVTWELGIACCKSRGSSVVC